MTYLSKNYVPEFISAHEIFYATHYDYKGIRYQHYFYCIYSQRRDSEAEMARDIIGLMISSKKQKGYVVEVDLDGKIAYVCCDIEMRFISDVDKVQRKNKIKLDAITQQKIMSSYRDFTNAKFEQLEKGLIIFSEKQAKED